MMYYYLEPEVAGWIGEGTIWDRSYHPPIVTRLDYALEGWLGDVLLEAFPCWIVTVPAMKQIQAVGLTGVSFDQVELTETEMFREVQPKIELPQFVWMKVHGVQGYDDFGVEKGFRVSTIKQKFDPHLFILVVSQRALDVLKQLGISHAKIEHFPVAAGANDSASR